MFRALLKRCASFGVVFAVVSASAGCKSRSMKSFESDWEPSGRSLPNRCDDCSRHEGRGSTVGSRSGRFPTELRRPPFAGERIPADVTIGGEPPISDRGEPVESAQRGERVEITDLEEGSSDPYPLDEVPEELDLKGRPIRRNPQLPPAPAKSDDRRPER